MLNLAGRLNLKMCYPVSQCCNLTGKSKYQLQADGFLLKITGKKRTVVCLVETLHSVVNDGSL